MYRPTRATRSSLTLALLLAAALLAGCGGSNEQVAEENPFAGMDDDMPSAEEMVKPVAEVNGVPILARQVWIFSEIEKMKWIANGQTFDEEAEIGMRRLALRMIIDDELMIQAAKSESMEPSPELIEQRLQDMRANFGSEAEYDQYLERANLTSEQIEEETRRRALSSVWAATIQSQVQVDEEQVKAYYDEMKWEQFKQPEQVRVAFIMTAAGPADPPEKREAAKAKIEAAKKLLEAGQPFPKIARQMSEDAQTAPNGGDLGFHMRGGNLLKEFEELAFNMEKGELSPIFETLHGYNILTVVSKREERVLPYDEVRPTLLSAAGQVEANRVLNEKITALRDEAEIKYLDDELAPAPEGAQPASNG